MSSRSAVEYSDSRSGPRRRRRDGQARRRQILVRFSDEEWGQITGRAGEADLAVGAWIGQVAVEAATGRVAPVGLPDLLRLHSDVLRVQSAAPAEHNVPTLMLRDLVERLDEAIDAVVAEIERSQR